MLDVYHWGCDIETGLHKDRARARLHLSETHTTPQLYNVRGSCTTMPFSQFILLMLRHKLQYDNLKIDYMHTFVFGHLLSALEPTLLHWW